MHRLHARHGLHRRGECSWPCMGARACGRQARLGERGRDKVLRGLGQRQGPQVGAAVHDALVGVRARLALEGRVPRDELHGQHAHRPDVAGAAVPQQLLLLVLLRVALLRAAQDLLRGAAAPSVPDARGRCTCPAHKYIRGWCQHDGAARRREAHGGHVVEGARARDGPLRPHVDGQAEVCAEAHSAPVTPLQTARCPHQHPTLRESHRPASRPDPPSAGCSPAAHRTPIWATAHRTPTQHKAHASEQGHAAPTKRQGSGTHLDVPVDDPLRGGSVSGARQGALAERRVAGAAGATLAWR